MVSSAWGFRFRQDEDDPESWFDPTYVDADASDDVDPVCVIATNTAEPPGDSYQQMIQAHLDRIGELAQQAALHILPHYDLAYCQSIGMPASRLPDPTPEGVAAAITLEVATFADSEGVSFEMSFGAPWDPEHSFEVRFENGEAVGCEVSD